MNLPNYQNLVKLSKTDPYGSHRIDAMDGILRTDTVNCMDGIPASKNTEAYRSTVLMGRLKQNFPDS